MLLICTFSRRIKFNVLQPVLLENFATFSNCINLSPKINISKSIEMKYNKIFNPANLGIGICSHMQERLIPSTLGIGITSLTQKRWYSKAKDKKGKSGKQIHSHITDEELSEVINLEHYRNDLEAIIDHLKEDFITNLSVRTSLGSLESLPVELDGDIFQLSEIAQVIRKNPNLVVINATAFPQAVNNIKKSISDSGMNLNPQQEGTSIFVPVPKVTKEYREGLAQNTKTLCDQCKVHIRDTQNKYIKKIRNKNGTVSEDLMHNAQLKVREIAQETSSQVDTMMKNKQNELLKANK